MNYLDNFIPDRIRLIKEDKNPDHILEILNKHFQYGMDNIRSRYKVELNIQLSRSTVSGNYEDTYNLVNLLQIKGVNIFTMTQRVVSFDIDDFIRKVY